MKIRIAHTHDILKITEVIQKSYATVSKKYDLTPCNYPKHPSSCAASWIEEDFTRGITYYAGELDQEIIGCRALEQAAGNICYLKRLAVVPEQ